MLPTCGTVQSRQSATNNRHSVWILVPPLMSETFLLRRKKHFYVHESGRMHYFDNCSGFVCVSGKTLRMFNVT
jgi:hypothetical protein